MKKVLVLSVLFSAIFVGFVFGADNYTVQNITGKVDTLGSSGQWITVSVGDILSPSTTVKIGINSVLVVKNGDKEEVIRAAARQGTLESFLGGGTARISVGGNVVNSNVSVPASGTSNISTSATRASDAASDLDWAE
ncbi:hypothetical protein [Treponema primitia]|uniref:hypothetical protein n=1 Tax=Treponema primitia TaxID=88058 RepID=UPI0002554E07|nr:hypothetical protein [Treponema primitia]